MTELNYTRGVVVGADFSSETETILHVSVPTHTVVSKSPVVLLDPNELRYLQHRLEVTGG